MVGLGIIRILLCILYILLRHSHRRFIAHYSYETVCAVENDGAFQLDSHLTIILIQYTYTDTSKNDNIYGRVVIVVNTVQQTEKQK